MNKCRKNKSKLCQWIRRNAVGILMHRVVFSLIIDVMQLDWVHHMVEKLVQRKRHMRGVLVERR